MLSELACYQGLDESLADAIPSHKTPHNTAAANCANFLWILQKKSEH